MKKIELSKGKYALVDDEDFKYISKWKWTYHSTHVGGYASRRMWKDGKRIAIYMHREVNKTPDNYITDHINQNKLDNRRKNLRTVSHSQNQMNTGLRKNNRSGFKGIGWNKQFRKWRARITVDKKTILIGDYLLLEDAVSARRDAEKVYHY